MHVLSLLPCPSARRCTLQPGFLHFSAMIANRAWQPGSPGGGEGEGGGERGGLPREGVASCHAHLPANPVWPYSVSSLTWHPCPASSFVVQSSLAWGHFPCPPPPPPRGPFSSGPRSWYSLTLSRCPADKQGREGASCSEGFPPHSTGGLLPSSFQCSTGASHC